MAAITNPFHLNHYMTTIAIPTDSIDLTDFDFTVDRTRFMSISEPHDGTVTIRMPGKNRKTANHELVFVPYFKKHSVKFKTVAIGRNKKKAQTPIVVFDQNTLDHESATIRKYDKLGGIVNSKGHALKILEIFKIAIPTTADAVIKIYFRLHPTVVAADTLNYRICTISLMKIIKNGHQKEPWPPRLKERKPGEEGSSKPIMPDKEEKNTTTNIL